MCVCVPESVWKRPCVNMTIWKEGRGEKKRGHGRGGGEQHTWGRGRVEGEERRVKDVVCTTAALWRVGLTLSQSTSDAQIRAPLLDVFKLAPPRSSQVQWSVQDLLHLLVPQ